MHAERVVILRRPACGKPCETKPQASEGRFSRPSRTTASFNSLPGTEVPGYFRVVPLGRKEKSWYEALSAPRPLGRKERSWYEALSAPCPLGRKERSWYEALSAPRRGSTKIARHFSAGNHGVANIVLEGRLK